MAGRPAAEILAELEPLGVRLGLETFRQLLAALGSPERAVPAVLVAGTNGKGSVAAMLDSIVRSAGLRSGLYTSPHLESYCERIRICGAPIAEELLAERLEQVLTVAEQTRLSPPTVFEALTAVAFLAFLAEGLDLAVLEVGLGGRLDATNAAEPALSVITRIALDHRAELGDSLTQIAREKAGVLRPDLPVVIASQSQEAGSALAEAAQRIGAVVQRAETAVTIERTIWRGLHGHALELRTLRHRYALDLKLAGEHQIGNAAVAVLSAELLGERFPAIDPATIADGIAAARWPARLEPLDLPGGRTTLLLDAAHNPDGCSALTRFLERLARPFDLVFGCLADKEAAGMLPPLAARAGRTVLTRPSSPRAEDPANLSCLVPASGRAIVVETPAAALDEALADGPELLVVAGSIYLAAELRREALERGEPVVGS